MGLLNPNCRCAVGAYLVEAQGEEKARCKRCDKLCHKACRGPPTSVVVDGITTNTTNADCPERVPDVMLLGEEFGNPMYVTGPACYMYSFNDIVFIVPVISQV